MLNRAWRLIKWITLATALLVVLLLLPVGYIELFCRHDPDQTAYTPIITEKEFQRAEANSYLTYPEWHIVYAYEGLAKVLETGDEHEFDYLSSVRGFWSSYCALNRRASRHGGGDFETRSTIHTIGVSFTLEMAMKAIYEESLGRLFAELRGAQKSPQDIYSATMAADYAQFLQQVPWYQYDFDSAVNALWQQPLSSLVRGWERRLALGGEWKAKAAYARVIASAVAATGQAQLRIRSVVKGLPSYQLTALADIDIVRDESGLVVIETPRYRKFTRIVQKVSDAGGQIVEIAGNDDIMVSIIEPFGLVSETLYTGELISRITRDGYQSNRLLVGLKVSQLPDLLADLDSSTRTLEHIYDY